VRGAHEKSTFPEPFQTDSQEVSEKEYLVLLNLGMNFSESTMRSTALSLKFILQISNAEYFYCFGKVCGKVTHFSKTIGSSFPEISFNQR
jgi:hypothetical protein